MNTDSTTSTTADDTPLLETQSVCVAFSQRIGWRRVALHAVSDVSLRVAPGRTLGLVGESGCGKSTLARAILGLTQITAGKILFEGQDVAHLHPEQRRKLRARLQIVFQDPAGSLNPRLTVERIVGEGLDSFGLTRGPDERRERVAEALRQVGLRAEDMQLYPHQFSGGQRQRIGLARAIAVRPRLLICDEPVSALDVSVRGQALNLLSELRDRHGLAYLFIAHDLALVRRFCDEVAVMYLGRIVEQGPAEHLFNDPRHPYTRALLAASPSGRPERRGQLARLQGEPPSPLAPPPGCAFAPRCPRATAHCAEQRPALTPRAANASHAVACHYAENEDS